LNKVVATFEKHIFLSQTDLTRTGIIRSVIVIMKCLKHPNSEAGNDEIQNVQREDFYFVGITF
jgi:hypothetical protein